MVESVAAAFGIAWQSTTVQKLFPVPLFGRHLESVVSNVRRDRCRHIQVGNGRKFGIAIGIMSVRCWKLKLHRPAEQEISAFYMEGALGFPGLSRY